MLIVRAPLRVSFAGGGTDLSAYYERFGGVVVSTTIDKYFYVFLSLNGRDSVQVSSADYSTFFRKTKPGGANFGQELSHVSAFLEAFDVHSGVSVFLASEVPPGTGLGSSSAVAVALAKALSVLCDASPTPGQLAEYAAWIEIERLGMPIGRQDQYAAASGGLNVIRFSAAGVTVEPLELRPEIVAGLERRTMLFHTGLSRHSGKILEEQRDSTLSGSGRTVEALHRIREIAESTIEVLRAGDLTEFAALLNQSWREKKQLAGGVTNGRIDEAYDAALAHGASGGKIAGAGGGGFLILYCDEAYQDAVTAELESRGLTRMDFRFEGSGVTVLTNALPRTVGLARLPRELGASRVMTGSL